MSFIFKLNPAQKAAVQHYRGPMMVLAGPGSGKTMVITRRIRTLIETYGTPPSHILVVTFTRAAAKEMQDRFQKLTRQITGVTFGTFHSVFFHILKYAYHYDARHILREEQKKAVIREIVSQLELEVQDYTELIGAVLNEISAVKGNRGKIHDYKPCSCSVEQFQFIYQSYETWLRKANRIDFDDMQGMCYELFSARPDILKAWQQKYQYILVDEFQDICELQYDLVRMLARPRDNLFIVGDDDQSIYRFRGARPDIMLHFPEDYPQAKQVLLDTNYRCDGAIVEASLRLINHNTVRFPKAIKSIKPSKTPVAVASFQNQNQEYEQIIKDIQLYKEAGYSYQDIAILYRTNLTPRLLMKKLMEYQLPFSTKDKVPNLFDHFIAQDLLAYFRFAKGDHSRATFLKIVNRPNRFIPRSCLSEPQVSLEQLTEYFSDKDWMQERIWRLEYDLNWIGKMAPYAAVNYMRHAMGYEGFLTEYAALRHLNAGDLVVCLDEIQESAKDFRTFEEWMDSIQAYQEELECQRTVAKERTDTILLSTMHSSKGLEFPLVFLLEANEGITPHKKAVLDEELEEERRLFYVAMTRAKTHLHIYRSEELFHQKQQASRFLGELI